MSVNAGELLHEVVDALPAADPVGAIVAALRRHDQTVDRLVLMAARARGIPEDVVRIEIGLPLYASRPATDLVERPSA